MDKQEEMKKTAIRPLGDRVITQRVESEEKAKGGIILPDSAKKKQEWAKVLAIGPGKKSESGKELPIAVKVGETILVDKYSGQEVTIDDQEYIIVRSDDIIAKIEG